MTGCDLAAQMVAIRPTLPVILVTGYEAQVDALRVKALGLREIVLKPMTTQALAEAVQRALATPKSG